MLFLTDLLFAPINGFKFVMRTLAKVAEEQYTDDAPLKESLLELQVKLEEGTITEDEYVEEEAAILRELREIQNRKRELAGAPREELDQPFGGVVGEGSGASLTYTPHADLPQLEIEAPQFTYGETAEPLAESAPVNEKRPAKPRKAAPKKRAVARRTSRKK